jgi:hypothetical protein
MWKLIIVIFVVANIAIWRFDILHSFATSNGQINNTNRSQAVIDFVDSVSNNQQTEYQNGTISQSSINREINEMIQNSKTSKSNFDSQALTDQLTGLAKGSNNTINRTYANNILKELKRNNIHLIDIHNGIITIILNQSDTLSALSTRIYYQNRTNLLLQYNKDNITNANFLKKGTKIYLPISS